METFAKSPIYLRVALFLPPLASLLQLIGLVCPNWISDSSSSLGLWKMCSTDTCIDYPALPDWMKGVRAVEVLGFYVAFVTVFLIALSIFNPNEQNKIYFKYESLAACFIADLFIIIGVSIFIHEMRKGIPEITDYLSWAFGLCTTSFILFIICGVLIVMSLVM